MKKEKRIKILDNIWVLFLVIAFIYFGVDHLTKEEPTQFDIFVAIFEFVFAFILGYTLIFRPLIIYVYHFFRGLL